ncbi:MAG TPA: polymer-forming cytoskeletal protein [Casimicrobiaceae bacterium]
MFKRDKPAGAQKRIDSLIGAGTTVHGDVVFSGGLRIDGRVEGNVATADGQPGTLVVSEQARVDGEVSVSHVVINGTVNGPVRADDYLELQAKARIAGDLCYRRLEMQTGAVVQGRLEHVEPESAPVVELRLAAAE